MSFDFKRHLIKVQGAGPTCPFPPASSGSGSNTRTGDITEAVEINHEKQYAVFRATVFNAEGKIMATGTKKEDVKGFGDYMEKAETGAVGRALALCGFGTQFSPELDEVGGGRLADSPQPMGGSRYGGGNNGGGGGSYGGGNRYGNGGGGTTAAATTTPEPRFAPPREVSAPANTRPDSGSRPEEAAPRAAAPSLAPRPAPAPVSTEDDEDDFEALVGTDAILDATEEDPFGDASAAPAARPAAVATPVRAEAKSDGPPACGGCGKALTKAQNDLSIRNYGEALCPILPARKAPCRAHRRRRTVRHRQKKARLS